MEAAAKRRFSALVVLTDPVVGVLSYMKDTKPESMDDTDHMGFQDSGW